MAEDEITRYRVNTYTGGHRYGRDWLRDSNVPTATVTLDREELVDYLARRAVPMNLYALERGTWCDANVRQEYTWAPVGQCSNAWHTTEGQGRNSRCPDCPPLTDHALDGNIGATTVLREIMYRLGLPARHDLIQEGAVAVDMLTHGQEACGVAVKVPGGPKYRITVEELA